MGGSRQASFIIFICWQRRIRVLSFEWAANRGSQHLLPPSVPREALVDWWIGSEAICKALGRAEFPRESPGSLCGSGAESTQHKPLVLMAAPSANEQCTFAWLFY